jgi:steroid Delta-isomerase
MAEPSVELQRVVRFFETISKQSLAELAQVYGPDAYFKDPFNEVRGFKAIQRIFLTMFDQVDAPGFKVIRALQSADNASSEASEVFLVWEFSFRFKRFKQSQVQCVRGSSHLRLDQEGKIVFHRDYWDVAEELYEKIPLLGTLMRFVKRQAQH